MTDFAAQYQNWSDEKLVDAWKNRVDYTEEAVQAIRLVLEQRNPEIIEQMEQDERQQQAQEQLRRERKLKQAERLIEEDAKQHERDVLGVDLSDHEYVQHIKQVSGKLLGGYLSPHGARHRIYWPVTLGIMSFVCIFVDWMEGPLFAHSRWIFLLAGFLLIGWGVFVARRNRVRMRLYQDPIVKVLLQPYK
jgi:hypothetical protein